MWSVRLINPVSLFFIVAAFQLGKNEGTEQRRPRIIGGTEVTPGDLPWQVSIQFVWWSQLDPTVIAAKGHYCGGTIVDETHIVTAAHCLTYGLNQMVVVAGAHNIYNRHEPTQQLMLIKRKTLHPRYNKATIENDIGVITLTQPLNFTDRVQPLRLAPKGHEPSGSCVASGFGYYNNTFSRPSRTFQQVDVMIVHRIPCKRKLPGLKPSMVCAGGARKDKGTCGGDSGGPLTCYDLPDGLPYLAGAVSWGRSGPCGQYGYPTAFAHASYLRRFLDTEIAIP